jgi:hypothetical protein
MATKKKEAALPKQPAACADLLYTTREQRLALQKQVDELKALETRLKEFFIDTLPKSQATGVAGKLARVTVVQKTSPIVEDWEAFYAYVKKNNAFELMQKRLSDTAVKERWEDGKTIPGVTVNHYVDVSLNKVG